MLEDVCFFLLFVRHFFLTSNKRALRLMENNQGVLYGRDSTSWHLTPGDDLVENGHSCVTFIAGLRYRNVL